MTKKIYNQPEVQVAQIALESTILVDSPFPAPGSGAGKLNDISSDDQW